MGIFNVLKNLANKDKYKREGENYLDNSEEVDNASSKENSIEEKDIIEDIECIENFKEIESPKDNKENKNILIEYKELTEEEIEKLIVDEINNVIEAKDNFDEVKIRSKEAANNIGVQNLYKIVKYLTKERKAFDKYHDEYEDKEHFNTIVDNSILMIIFSFKEDSVNILEKISQKDNNMYLKATNLLCKLASEKVKTEEILDKIINNIMVLNDENRIITLGFMSQIKENGRVIGIIQYFYKEYLRKGELEKAFKTLNHLINAAERYTEGHLRLLKEISQGNKKINLQHIMILEEKDPKYIMVDKISEELRVEAAITYYLINPKDKEIKDTLKYLSEYSLNEKLRKKIKELVYN
ncbi:hypothetical protein [Clostridium sp.]|uniref:hypothetical protein n=1 Tax=Clostridium sp. TaxID=1506 RepID=UPI0026155242|nr:hypothetical protein [Clostridium sp.]